MLWKVLSNGIRIQGCGRISLAQTFDCGQCFRWEEEPEGFFTGIVRGRVCRVRQEQDGFFIENQGEQDFQEIWQPYFDLGQDYDVIREQLSDDPVLRDAVAYAGGIRLLRQEPWEALCSFIISQNNNIKRIKGIIQRLCETLGDTLEGGYHTFPAPEKFIGLAVEDLEPLRCGFRAKYILDAAEKVVSGVVKLDDLGQMPLEQALQMLMEIRGVGPKVARCALLFGAYRLECVPEDVWIKRVMASLYPQGLPASALPYAGIAQQFLFHYVRNNPVVLECVYN